MTFIVKGYDPRFTTRRKAKVFAAFRERSECYRYLNKLKTGSLSATHIFFAEEVHSNEIPLR